MLKKALLVSSILAVSTGIAMANTAPYVGASTGITTNTSSTQGVNSRGVPFNVFVGYGGVISQGFYLAGEVLGSLGTAQLSNNGIRTTYGYGASILPGLMIAEHTMGFARLGVIRTHFTSGGSSMSTGGQFGLGMQTTLMQNVDLRGEYDFNDYKSVNNISSPKADAFTVGLIYKFD